MEVPRVPGGQNQIVASRDSRDLSVEGGPRLPALIAGSHDLAPDSGGPIVERKDPPFELTRQIPGDPLLVAQGSITIAQFQGAPDQLSQGHCRKEEITRRSFTKPTQHSRFGPWPNRLADDVRVQQETGHSKSTGRPKERSRSVSSSVSRRGEARRNSTRSAPVAAGARTTSVSRSCRRREASRSSSRSVRARDRNSGASERGIETSTRVVPRAAARRR